MSFCKSGFANVKFKIPSTWLSRNACHILIFHSDFELNTLVKNISHLFDEIVYIFTLVSLKKLRNVRQDDLAASICFLTLI